MNTKNHLVSITVIVTIAAIFLSSSGVIVNPLLAKSSKSEAKTDSTKSTKKGTSTATTTTAKTPTATTTTTTTPSSSSSSISDQNNYKKFLNCLSTAAGTKGFATNQEIKNCYNPIYRSLSSPTTTASPTTTIAPPTTSFSGLSTPLSSSVK